MDKSKRKKLIESYLKNSINIQEFTREVSFDIQAMSDPVLSEILLDLRERTDAKNLKSEIFTFNKEQDELLTSLGSDYIENRKNNLTFEVTKYGSLLADSEIRTILEEWETTNGKKAFEKSAEEFKNTSFTHVLKFLKNNTEYISELQEIINEIGTENEYGLTQELQELSDALNDRIEEKNKENNINKQQEENEELWINRLKENDSKVAEITDGVQKKQEVIQLIHDLEKEDIQRNSDNEQR